MPDDAVQLTADQARALDQAAKMVDDARSGVGDAYLRYEEAKAAFERAQEGLRRSVAGARQAEAQHGAMLRGVAQVLQLPAGEWVYDASSMRLVRRGHRDA